MKFAKLFCLGLALAAAAGAASAQSAPALYSFEDIYRLAVAGATGSAAQDSARQGGLQPVSASDPQIRVAAVQAAPGAELHFTIEPLPGPHGWLLLLAGLAAAGWVAHRRLGQF